MPRATLSALRTGLGALPFATTAANEARLDAPRDAARAKAARAGWLGLAARWPLQALLAWGSAWLGFAALKACGAPLAVAACAATALGALWMLFAATATRRAIVALGFPLSLLASGLGAAAFAGLPAWAWLAPLVLLALVYPASTWRDAPLFPTPAGALDALALHAPLEIGARVHDAGCGLGHGLAALRRAYPQARLEGSERSAPVALLARLFSRRALAQVRHADMWACDWRGLGMVYLFQRPESLPRAVAKARAELPDGAWLVSLEFPALELSADKQLNTPDGRALWLYRAPFATPATRAAASFTRPAAVRMPRASGPRRERR
ncbi:MAG TPA: class I SAM-dependent methyltransferase [Methylibium sp.]|uniref:class I SAM-dependent methyltransferase n=1 Tax=Methylibium sp. TaxID=2067992 RepID=UPI002DBBE12E|nr:class I SAM-dependent methyltransferase [Methylibium sp.]HEU4457620.1 class I SAM-dependent methyltransferase [Methylibium sp.]